MRRLLFVIHYPIFGGPQNQALRLTAPLAEAGWETVVLMPDEPGEGAARLRAAGITVRQAPLSRVRARVDPRLHLKLMRDFRRDVRLVRDTARECGADLVMLGGLVNPQAALAGRAEGLPVVWQIVDTMAPLPMRAAYFPLLRRYADAILVAGERIADLHPGLNRLGDRLVPFFPPVDAEMFTPNPATRSRVRAELGIPTDALVVGTASRITPLKELSTFIQVAAEVRRARPDVPLLVIGAPDLTHADYAERLWQEARGLGLEPGRDLQAIDPGSRMHELAQALDVFLLTSRSEGVPTTIGEAMALGIPVVASDVGGVAEAVDDGVSGYVVPARDVQAFADATLRILADDGLRGRLSRAAIEGATRYSVARSAAAHLEAFEKASARAALRRRSHR